MTELLLIAALFMCMLLNYQYLNPMVIDEPEVQVNMILCMVGHSTNDYLVMFRVVPATPIASTWDESCPDYIDFQLLTIDNEPIGIPCRYAANFVQDQCLEMHMLVCRISPLPPITALLAYNSNPNSVLLLYDFSIVDLITNQMVQVEVINRPISNTEASIIRLHSGKNLTKGTHRKPKLKDWLPLIFANQLTINEYIPMASFIITFIWLIMIVCCRFLKLILYWKDGFPLILLHYGIFVLCATAISLIIIAIIETIYIHYVKRYVCLQILY